MPHLNACQASPGVRPDVGANPAAIHTVLAGPVVCNTLLAELVLHVPAKEV